MTLAAWQRWNRRLCFTVVLAAVAVALLDGWIDRVEMPPLTAPSSVAVLDRDGAALRVVTAADGRWRLPVALDQVDRGYVAQLVAYEDRRFYLHPGVDPVALLRALAQGIATGRVRSGGSTLTMQVARLLDQGTTGRWRGKLRQIRLALALERRLGKREILELYMTRAPFGGNLEGVRAASLSYFGKEPTRLTPAEAAFLVALPQSPESRRPDRAPQAARAGRDAVLDRMRRQGVLTAEDHAAARRAPSPTMRLPFPASAPHLADRLIAAAPDARFHRTTLHLGTQRALEALVADHVARLHPRLSAAVIVMDRRTGAVRAHLGSAGYLATRRAGFIDMTRAVRSPGSTLKPLIYGLAFEAGLAHPGSLIEDRRVSFGTYSPQNFDKTYRGTVRVAEALQLSLNIPAVALLEAVGPARLLARLNRMGVTARTPGDATPGLALALGGAGVTLEDLMRLFGTLANGGTTVPLHYQADAAGTQTRALSPVAAWYVTDILRGVAPPMAGETDAVAYKTGTSYGHRDAWAIGYDGAHVIGVWIGRADAGAVPGILGIDAAAPLLFEAFSRVSPRRAPFAAPPPDALIVSGGDLPAPLRRFGTAGPGGTALHTGPQIVYPPQGAEIDLGLARGGPADLVVKLRGGAPPFTWMIDGAVVPANPFERSLVWPMPAPGFVTVTVLDASGASLRRDLVLR